MPPSRASTGSPALVPFPLVDRRSSRRSGRARLFVAVNLPEAERSGIHRAVSPLRASDLPVRWVPANNLHVTLAFLGDVEEERIGRISEALLRVGREHAPFTLDLRGLGAFPNLRRPRVLWIGAEGGPALRAVQRGVAAALKPLGFAPDDRVFHPHVTVGRAQKHARPGDFGEFTALSETVTYQRRVGIHTVDLMRSQGGPDGVRYHVLAQCPLGGPE